MKKTIALTLLLLGLLVLLAPAAMAAPSSGAQIVAQESPTPGCELGQGICDPGQGGFVDPVIDFSKVNDPPGATVRSLVMIGLLAVGFVVYLRLALVRGSKVG